MLIIGGFLVATRADYQRASEIASTRDYAVKLWVSKIVSQVTIVTLLSKEKYYLESYSTSVIAI